MKRETSILGTLIATTLVSLPLYVVRCSSFSFCVSPLPFTLLEVFILLTFGFWFYSLLKHKVIKNTLLELKKRIPPPAALLILIFLLSALAAALISPNLRAGLGIYKAYFLEGFLLFIVILDYLRRTRNYKLVLWSLVVSGIWVALLAILNQLFSYNPGNPDEFLERGRSSALYTTSNAVGLFLSPVLILLFGYFFTLKNQKKSQLNEEKLVIFGLIILFGGLLASGSRGAFLGIIVGLIFFFLYFLYHSYLVKFKKTIIIALTGLITLLFLGHFLIFLNMSHFAKNTPVVGVTLQGTFNQRLCLWDGAVEIIKAKPLLGSGLSGFQLAHDHYRTCSQENSLYPHNIFLNFWTELGIFGLISFVGLTLYFTFKLLFDGKLDYVRAGLVGVFIVVLVHGLVDVPFFKNDLSAQLWTILALGLAKIRG